MSVLDIEMNIFEKLPEVQSSATTSRLFWARKRLSRGRVMDPNEISGIIAH